MVAVVPEARGRGITGKLIAHALADAVERGSETAHAGRHARSATRSTSGWASSR